MTDTLPSRKRRKEARPAEILSAALALFHSKGFAASKIDDVARAAGVTKGTIYLYYRGKEALFKAAIRETVLPNIDRIEAAVQQDQPARTRLRQALQMWAEALAGSRGSLLKLMIAEAGNFPDLGSFFQEEVSGRVRRLIEGIVESGIAAGEFSACDPAMVTRTLCGPILLSDIWRHTFPQQSANLPDLSVLADAVLDIVLRGIDNQPSSTTP